MRNDPAVIKAYAVALFDAAGKKGIRVPLREEAASLLKVLEGTKGLRPFFEAPHIPTDRKEAMIARALEGRFHELIYSFVRLLLRKNRLEVLRESLGEFIDLVHREQGIHAAMVTTARELSLAEKMQLKTALEQHTKFKLTINYLVIPEVIGGVMFTCDDQFIDGTLRGSLKRIERRLSAARVTG